MPVARTKGAKEGTGLMPVGHSSHLRARKPLASLERLLLTLWYLSSSSSQVVLMCEGPPSRKPLGDSHGCVWVQPAGWARDMGTGMPTVKFSCVAALPLSLPPMLPWGTSGWNAWQVSGRRRSFWDRIRSHFTEALCVRLLRTMAAAGREKGDEHRDTRP